jgi:hypothetical protein
MPSSPANEQANLRSGDAAGHLPGLLAPAALNLDHQLDLQLASKAA